MDKKRQDIAYFLSFCIEQYMNEKGISKNETMALFSEFEVLGYLAEHFEILHTQNHHWIIEDIEEYIKIRTEEKE